MKSITLLLVATSLLTQGCASALQNATPSDGTRFGEIQSDRPTVTDAVGAGQTALPSFGTTRVQVTGPKNIPLPAQADPRSMFVVPSLRIHTANAMFVGTGIALDILCGVPDMGGGTDAGCRSRPSQDFEKKVPAPVANKGPVILR